MRLAHMVIDAVFCPLQHRAKGFGRIDMSIAPGIFIGKMVYALMG